MSNRVLAHTGAKYPIIQAPMGWIARSQLASAVSNAGGLGGDLASARALFDIPRVTAIVLVVVGWPDVDEALYRFMIDLQLAAHVRIGQDVMGESFCPKQATYSGQAPADITHWERVLHAPVAFGQAANTLRFDATLLTRAPQLAHPITASHLSVQCARLLEEASWGAGMTRRVYEELTRHGGRFPSIEEVASRLCMTSRTLRRRLEAEGAGFSDLLAAVRAFHARKLNVHCHCNGNATGQVFVEAEMEEVAQEASRLRDPEADGALHRHAAVGG